ncbi:MAG: hypothetical protein KDK97_24695, partial [Verrucomicrobiales bacterium]|nr:hypothetical protein [Verrucomicrobiales bacterium]
TGCSLVTVPVKTAGGIVTTTVKTTGDIVTAPFDAVGRRQAAPEGRPAPQEADERVTRPAPGYYLEETRPAQPVTR